MFIARSWLGGAEIQRLTDFLKRRTGLLIVCCVLIGSAVGAARPTGAVHPLPATPRSTPTIGATPGLKLTAVAGSPAPHRDNEMAELEACILGTWIHSHEEDTPEGQVYRHPGYPFPPARGRRGFELREGGDAMLAGIAPTDGSQRATARWTLEEREITIEPGEGPMPPMTFEVISCDEEMLRVKR